MKKHIANNHKEIQLEFDLMNQFSDPQNQYSIADEAFKSKPKVTLKEQGKALANLDINNKKIVRANRKHLIDDKEIIFEDIENSNSIELWDLQNERNNCKCGEILKSIENNKVYFHVKGEPVFVMVSGKYCSRCDRMYIVKGNLNKAIKTCTRLQKDFLENKKEKPEEKIKSTISPTSLIEFHYFFVYTNNLSCKKLGHDLIRETAVVGVGQKKSGNPFIQQYEIPVCRCNKCRVYYISEDIYVELNKRGIFLPKVLSKMEFNNKKYIGSKGFEHVMHKFGYNVLEDGPGRTERQKLLKQLIEGEIVSKDEAVKHIKGLIRLNRSKKRMSNAIIKWREDIEFLTGKQLKIGVKAIVVSEDIKRCSSDNYLY